MTTYSEIVLKISETANKEDMLVLNDMTSEFIENIRQRMPADVDKFLMKIDLRLNPCFTKETAEYAVSKMENDDGTKGAHWNWEQVKAVYEENHFNFNLADFFYVLNMVYSDYYEKDSEKDYYLKLAKKFLADKDAPKGKAKKYWLAMNCE